MFAYDPAILERFPALRAGVVHVADVSNGASPPALIERARETQRRALARLDAVPIPDMPSIRAWREVFHACGVKPTRHRVAVEALLRRLEKRGEVPSINLLVDIGNAVAIEHALPVAVFDRASLSGTLTVRFARGDERFVELGVELGADAAVAPSPGEVVFVDDGGEVAARRWCWRQGAGCAAGATTSDALFVVEGHHEGAADDVARAVADLREWLTRFVPDCRPSSRALPSEASQDSRFTRAPG